MNINQKTVCISMVLAAIALFYFITTSENYQHGKRRRSVLRRRSKAKKALRKAARHRAGLSGMRATRVRPSPTK